MASLGGFANRMRNVRVPQLREGRLRIKRTVAAQVTTTVVNNTPILSGRARANWNIGFNRPNYTVTDPLYQSDQVAWQLKLSTSLIAISRASENDSIYISNALPYIGFLNRGGSQQAPRDFVLISTVAASRSIRGMRIFR